MSGNESSEETPIPEAPKGAAPSLDPKIAAKANGAANQDSEQYLNDRGNLTSEGMINQFRELREADDPINAILITEIQEVKQIIARMAQLSSIGMCVDICVIAFVCIYLVDKSKGNQ